MEPHSCVQSDEVAKRASLNYPGSPMFTIGAHRVSRSLLARRKFEPHEAKTKSSQYRNLIYLGMILMLLRILFDIVYFRTTSSMLSHSKADVHPLQEMLLFRRSSQDPNEWPAGRRHQRLLTAILSKFEVSATTSHSSDTTQKVQVPEPSIIIKSAPPALVELSKTIGSTCHEMNFESGVEYLGSDVLSGMRDSFESDATACCRRCEALEDCTHWTWSSNSKCTIRHGKLQRIETRYSYNMVSSSNHLVSSSNHLVSNHLISSTNHLVSSHLLSSANHLVPSPIQVVSGRVSLNSYVHRVYNPDVLKVGLTWRIKNIQYNALKAASVDPTEGCRYDPKDAPFLRNLKENSAERPASYIVINEPRSGSSWLQEISQMHPGIKVQFELDLAKGEAALRCMECHRPRVPVSKNVTRLPPKMHPPQACGMTVFGSANRFEEVSAMAERHNASLIILLRRNHVAHAISVYRHFNKPAADGLVPWGANSLAKSVDESRQAYDRLLEFAGRSGRRAHVVFYEDLKQQPREVWAGLQAFLGVPVVDVDGMEGLEKKSSNRPSVEYLRDLPAMQQALATEPWAEMLLNKRYDEDVFNAAAAFEDACRRNPTARMSWRGGACPPSTPDKVESVVGSSSNLTNAVQR